MAEEWKHGLCSCNSGTCCCVLCCAPCEVYKTAERIGESGILYGLLTCFLPCIGGMLLRRKIRKRYNIEGSDLEDAGISCLCTPCVICQNRDRRKGGTLKNYCKIIALIALSHLFCLLHKYMTNNIASKKIQVARQITLSNGPQKDKGSKGKSIKTCYPSFHHSGLSVSTEKTARSACFLRTWFNCMLNCNTTSYSK